MGGGFCSSRGSVLKCFDPWHAPHFSFIPPNILERLTMTSPTFHSRLGFLFTKDKNPPLSARLVAMSDSHKRRQRAGSCWCWTLLAAVPSQMASAGMNDHATGHQSRDVHWPPSEPRNTFGSWWTLACAHFAVKSIWEWKFHSGSLSFPFRHSPPHPQPHQEHSRQLKTMRLYTFQSRLETKMLTIFNAFVTSSPSGISLLWLMRNSWVWKHQQLAENVLVAKSILACWTLGTQFHKAARFVTWGYLSFEPNHTLFSPGVLWRLICR